MRQKKQWIAVFLIVATFLVGIVPNVHATKPSSSAERTSNGAKKDEAVKESEGMVLVPGGTFLMGRKDPSSDASPVHNMKVDAFWLDQTLVTTAAYESYLAGLRTEPSKKEAYQAALPDGDHKSCNYNLVKEQVKLGKENHPMNCINYAQAAGYCQAMGKRLPTEVEWEYAARGPKGSIYPWGNEEPTDKNVCFSGDKVRRLGTCPVGSYPKTLLGKPDKDGIADLTGNLSQLTDSAYSIKTENGDHVIISYPKHIPCGKDAKACVSRGGAWVNGGHSRLRSDERNGDDVIFSGFYSDGFRCAKSAASQS